MERLSRKIIREATTQTGSKKYTVTQLRKMVREEIKTANRILIDTEGGKKAPYLKSIMQDIAKYNLSSTKSGEYLTQSRVKWMKSSELMSAYNALQGLKEADMSSIEYAKRLAGKYDTMRQKWEKTTGKTVAPETFDQMMELFTKYEKEVEQFGYAEMLNTINKQRMHHSDEKLIDAINRVEKEHPSLGAKGVLKYISNEVAIKRLIEQGITLEEAFKIVGTQK